MFARVPGTRMRWLQLPPRWSTVLGALSMAACVATESPIVPDPPAPPPPPPTPQPELVCTTPDVPDTAFTPSRLLTRFEYDNTVRDLLGLPEDMTPSASFPPENRVMGFDNNAVAHVVSPLLVNNYADAAERLANLALSTQRARLVPCDPAVSGEAACGRAVITKLAPAAFRRALEPSEQQALELFFDTTLAAEGFDTAMSLVVQVILQSPQFLYRIEPGDPTMVEPSRLSPLVGAELATRLSYFLWGSAPDDELLSAAQRGELETTEGYRAQVQRLLAHPRARRSVRHFNAQALEAERLATIAKDRVLFPEFDAALVASWQGSFERFVEEAYFGQGGGLDKLMKDPSVWVDARLARHLQLPAPPEGEWRKVERDATVYAGILTQPALMAVLSLNNQSSPIKRGVFVREKLLCQTLPPPPPNVPIMPPDPDPNSTTRERFKEHTSQVFCASCHQRIDPIGFSLEAFDSLGRYRATEAGKTIDTTGELAWLRDKAKEGQLSGAHDLATTLAELDEVSDCFARQWFRYAIGREVQAADTCSLVNVQTVFAESGGDFRVLLGAIAETDAFRYRVVQAVQP